MQTLNPEVRPEGLGWYHRIDDIPDVYTSVEVVTTSGLLYKALVKPANGQIRSGCIGGEVVYDIQLPEDDLILRADEIAWIRTDITVGHKE